MDDKSLNLEPIAILRLSTQLRWGWVCVLGGIFLFTLSLTILTQITKAGVGWGIWLSPLGAGCLFSIFLFIWWRMELLLTEEVICSRSAFSKKIIPLRDVVEISIPVGDETHNGVPLNQLVVTTQDRNSRKNIVISLVPFHLGEFDKWLDSLQEQLAKRAEGSS